MNNRWLLKLVESVRWSELKSSIFRRNITVHVIVSFILSPGILIFTEMEKEYHIISYGHTSANTYINVKIMNIDHRNCFHLARHLSL